LHNCASWHMVEGQEPLPWQTAYDYVSVLTDHKNQIQCTSKRSLQNVVISCQKNHPLDCQIIEDSHLILLLNTHSCNLPGSAVDFSHIASEKTSTFLFYIVTSSDYSQVYHPNFQFHQLVELAAPRTTDASHWLSSNGLCCRFNLTIIPSKFLPDDVG
jgi:hypothetical protein